LSRDCVGNENSATGFIATGELGRKGYAVGVENRNEARGFSGPRTGFVFAHGKKEKKSTERVQTGAPVVVERLERKKKFRFSTGGGDTREPTELKES